ncbi:hypothetical protein, partial [Streptomyces sp. wa22]|uniref:hypothetical protein n=1 Tax=Streptomyces sp. wa22 TaxID=1828244 RepID=UPI0011C7FA03
MLTEIPVGRPPRSRRTPDSEATADRPPILLANRMPTEDGGAVATLRDRTEVEYLGRELDST